MKEEIINKTPEQIQDIVDNCVYASYKWNRTQFPEWSVDQWAKLFGMDAYLMELKYKEEMDAE